MREQRAVHVPPRASRTATHSPTMQPASNVADVYTDEYEVADDDSYYPQRMPTSTRRYVDTRGNQVIEQGKKRIVIHDEPPPKRKTHWLLILGIGMLLMLGLWLGLSWVENWWMNHQLDAAYGFPRTYQTD